MTPLRARLTILGFGMAMLPIFLLLPLWNVWQAIRHGRILYLPRHGARRWIHRSDNPPLFFYAVATTLAALSVLAVLAYVACRIAR